MKKVYPVVLTPAECGYVVSVPDLHINTEGTDIANSIDMARDAIGLWGISEEDAGRIIPEPSTVYPPHNDNEITTMIDIDFDAYRRANDMRTVRKNLTVPSWLNDMGEKAGLNFSQVLQDGIKNRLHIEN
jgi:predicted RNase H-like HicB family nuclease